MLRPNKDGLWRAVYSLSRPISCLGCNGAKCGVSSTCELTFRRSKAPTSFCPCAEPAPLAGARRVSITARCVRICGTCIELLIAAKLGARKPPVVLKRLMGDPNVVVSKYLPLSLIPAVHEVNTTVDILDCRCVLLRDPVNGGK